MIREDGSRNIECHPRGQAEEACPRCVLREVNGEWIPSGLVSRMLWTCGQIENSKIAEISEVRTPDFPDIPDLLMLRLWSVLTATVRIPLRNLMRRREIPSC